MSGVSHLPFDNSPKILSGSERISQDLSQVMLWSENHLLVVLAVLLEKEINISIEPASR